MREAAHDLADRAAVNAEVVGRLGLRPAKHFDSVNDMPCRLAVAGKLVFSHK